MPQPTRFVRFDRALVDTLSQLVDLACPPALWSQRQDITQQILLRLHRASLEQPLDVGLGYLRRAVRYGICDAWRRMAVAPVHGEPEHVSETPDPEHALSHRRTLEVARSVLQSLPAARRDAVSLYLEGQRIKEVADELGCPPKRADNLVFRGLSSLRRQLAASGYGSESIVMQ